MLAVTLDLALVAWSKEMSAPFCLVPMCHLSLDLQK